METNVDEFDVNDLFGRGVAEFFDPDNKFKDKCLKKARGEYTEDIIIKIGVDPNRPDIHLGHAVILRKLRKFQDLGCKVLFLIGDYTAQIGDPTGKSKVRPETEQKEVDRNAKTYIDQVGKILKTDEKVFSWIRNSEWYYGITDLEAKQVPYMLLNTTLVNPRSFVGKAILYEKTRMQKTHLKKKEVYSVTLKGLLWTLKHVSLSRLMQRDMFQDRLKKHEELFVHELLYPVLQGIDSYMISSIYGNCDMEIGGTDQTFNMLLGRDIMKINKKPSQAVMSIKILEGLDGKEKMSKSLNNYVAITDKPEDMYGKIMSIPDSSIINYFILCTYTPEADIKDIKKNMESGSVSPKNIKMRLAKEITAIYYGEEKAKEAESCFKNVFEMEQIPENIPEITAEKNSSLADLLVECSLVKSKGEFRRLISEGAITNIETKEKLTDPSVKITTDHCLRVGKKRFIRIKLKHTQQ